MIDDCTAPAARTWRWIPRVWQAWYISGGPGTPQEQIKQLRSLQLFCVTSVCRASDWRENKPWLCVSPQSPDYAKRAFKSSLNEGTDAPHNGWAGRSRPSEKDGGISQSAVALEMFQFKFNGKWQSFSNSKWFPDRRWRHSRLIGFQKKVDAKATGRRRRISDWFSISWPFLNQLICANFSSLVGK